MIHTHTHLFVIIKKEKMLNLATLHVHYMITYRFWW